MKDAPTRESMGKQAYATAASQQVSAHAPADLLTREWLPAWTAQLQALLSAGGLADVVALLVTRMELLGSLWTGETGEPKAHHFVAFADRFLAPVNPRAKELHNLSGASHGTSEMHASFRTRVLWGDAPPPHALANPDQGCVGFSVGEDEAHRLNHLRVLQQTLYLHVPILLAEASQAFALFAMALREDAELVPGLTLKPSERFRRGLWWRLRPSGLSTKVWTADGASRGIPAP